MKENSLYTKQQMMQLVRHVTVGRELLLHATILYIYIYIYIYICLETQYCAAIYSLRWILKKFYSGLSPPASRNTAITGFCYSEYKQLFEI